MACQVRSRSHRIAELSQAFACFKFITINLKEGQVNIIQGHFNGTALDLYLCLGTIPYNIEMWNLESATVETYEWDRAMLSDILTVEGIGRPKGGGAVLDMAFGEGIAPYYGGDTLTTAMATASGGTTVTYGEGVYLERDDKDYRSFTNAAAGISGDAATTDIVTWTLTTAGTAKGKFNGDVTGTYIGEGSLIRIQDINNKNRYFTTSITALTAGQGVADDEVTLSAVIPSGFVSFIGGKYGYKPMVTGQVTKPGVRISNTTLNANNGMVGFRALCP